MASSDENPDTTTTTTTTDTATTTTDTATTTTSTATETALGPLLAANKTWACDFRTTHASLLAKLGTTQTPRVLWLGCSDSRVPETTILGALPGDIFTHRNIANVYTPDDAAAGAALEFAVVHLKVEHVLLAGHTRCGGAAACIAHKSVGRTLDMWLAPVRRAHDAVADQLAALDAQGSSDDITNQKLNLVVYENVRQGVRRLRENPIVIRAMRERGMKVSGVVYRVETGELEIVDDTAAAAAAADSNNKSFLNVLPSGLALAAGAMLLLRPMKTPPKLPSMFGS